MPSEETDVPLFVFFPWANILNSFIPEKLDFALLLPVIPRILLPLKRIYSLYCNYFIVYFDAHLLRYIAYPNLKPLIAGEQAMCPEDVPTVSDSTGAQVMIAILSIIGVLCLLWYFNPPVVYGN